MSAPAVQEERSPAAAARCATPLEIAALTRRDEGDWDRFVGQAPGGTVFHTTGWMRAVERGFGHRPMALQARRGGRLVGVLPLVEVRSLLAGRMLVSVPYGIYGGVLGQDSEANDALLSHAAHMADGISARCVELRSQRAAWSGVPVVDRYVTFRKRLPESSAECLGALPRKARAAARAARDQHRLSVSFDDRQLPAVWRLYSCGMRRLASLNYPYRFFEELTRLAPGGHFVSLATYQGRPVGGLVTFTFNGVAMPYFVGVDPRFLKLNVYNYLYLTAMERAVEKGCHTFDFGRSRRDNAGGCAFKRNQGFEPETLEYQVYTPPGRTAPDLTPGNPRYTWARRLWPVMPLWLTRRLGARLSRHVPG